jgi:integrase/recombinase XerD
MSHLTNKAILAEYTSYLKLERQLAANTLEAYLRDLKKLEDFLEINSKNQLQNTTEQDIELLVKQYAELGIAVASQSRFISALRSFFDFMLINLLIDKSPVAVIDLPKIARYLPDTLDFVDIERILESIDLGTPEGFRNRSILETLYSSGMRVSELVNLEWSKVNLKEKYLKVIGKGNKERLVPLGSDAKNYLEEYYYDIRANQTPKKGSEDIVYLNRRGALLTRQMIFYICKNTASHAGLKCEVSPHTYRHSFATHLVEGGADLRVVQELLGHESITTTEIYTHLDKAYLSQTIAMYHPRS